MDEIKHELETLARYLDETRTLMHAGENTQEALGAAIFGLTKLTDLVGRIVEQLPDPD